MADNIPLSKFLKSSLPPFKLCRLCGSKDGPFLNIFGAGVDLAKKIESALLIMVAESDDLPHKVCFRCSAKVEDYHEFLEKCIKTQEKLSQMLGKDFNYKRDKSKQIKSKWEAKLNKNQLSNDEYCDELVMKALESVASLPKFENNAIIPILNSKDNRYMEEKKFIKLSPSGAPISYRSNLKLKKLKIKMIRVDRRHFPGVEKRNGKYFIVDIKKPSTLQTLVSGSCKPGPKRYKDKANANTNFDLLQNSLKKLQTKIVKKQTDAKNTEKLQTQIEKKHTYVKNTLPIAKETQSAENTMPIKPNTQMDERAIPENFSTVKVAEIGAVVYTCKLCHHSILEKDKMFNHKCLISRSNRDITTNKLQSSVENNHAVTTNTVPLHDNKPCENTSMTTRSRLSRSSLSKGKNNSMTKGHVKEQNSNNASNTNNPVPELGTVPTQSPIIPPVTLSNPDISTPQLGQSFSMAPGMAPGMVPGMGPNMDASLLSKSFFLMPMGDNSYSLQLRNPVNQSAPPPQAPYIHVNHLPTSSPSYANHQFPTSSPSYINHQFPTNMPSYINQQFTTSSPPYINQQFTSQSCIPTEHSILPDCNRPSGQQVTSLPASAKSSAAQQKPIEKLVISKKDFLNNYTNKKNSSNPKKAKSSREEVAVNIAPSAPYPIGLLCRNSSNQANAANANQHALPPEEISDKPPVTKGHKKAIPKYTILNPKTPGKIVISTVLNKPTKIAPKPPVEVPKKKARKQNLERKTEQETLSVEFEEEPSQEPVEEKNEHFFTYINLDPMLQSSPYTLPNPNALQEAKISTTVVPVTFERPSSTREKVPNKGSVEIGKKNCGSYSCSICDLEFSREKKLFAHVKTHFQGVCDD